METLQRLPWRLPLLVCQSITVIGLKLQALIGQTENKTSTLDALAQELLMTSSNQLIKLAAKALDFDIMERKLSDLTVFLQKSLRPKLRNVNGAAKGEY